MTAAEFIDYLGTAALIVLCTPIIGFLLGVGFASGTAHALKNHQLTLTAAPLEAADRAGT